MQRLRSQLRLGAWLALFALAFQLVASFGHVHGLEDSERSSVQLTSTTLTGADPASRNANDQTPDSDDDYCAVCALIHLIGTVVAAEPPSPALPALLGATCINFVPAEFETISASHAPFSARAPPVG
jgi:hypothetical protein